MTIEEEKNFFQKINVILNKKDYEYKLKNILINIAYYMRVYYGEEREEEILNTLDSVYIFVAQEEKSFEEFAKKNLTFSFDNIETEVFLSASFNWTPIVKGDKVEFEGFIYVPQEMNYLDLNVDNDLYNWCLQVLIHEINHAIKMNGYYNKIGNNIYEIYCGLESLICDANTTSYKFSNEMYSDLEESINTVQEYDIYKLVTNREPVQFGTYKHSQVLMRCLFDNFPNLKKIIVDAEFDKTKEWIDIIGLENVNKLNFLFQRDHASEETIFATGKSALNEFLEIFNELENNDKIKPRKI